MLNQQWGLIFWTLITFGISLFVLWRYAFGPIQKLIDDRRAHITESIEAAEGTRAEAARLLAEYRETLASVRAESEQILERSRKAGDASRAEILEEARRQAQRTVEKAQEQLDATCAWRFRSSRVKSPALRCSPPNRWWASRSTTPITGA